MCTVEVTEKPGYSTEKLHGTSEGESIANPNPYCFDLFQKSQIMKYLELCAQENFGWEII